MDESTTRLLTWPRLSWGYGAELQYQVWNTGYMELL